MNWQNINEFVEQWAAQRSLPVDLKGQELLLVDFESEADCQFFYPDRSLLSQQAFTSALARFARGRSARTTHIKITPEHYRGWLLAEKGQDNSETRERFIESRYRLAASKSKKAAN